MGKVVISVCSAVLSVVGILVSCNQAVGEFNKAAQAVKEYRNA